jgi:hypothetical protein
LKILFQGAGAIGIAGAALFTDAHTVAVASRASAPQPRAAYPRRVSVFDPSGDGPPADGHRADGRLPDGCHSAGWTVNRVASTRRVTITDWEHAHEAGRWDLIVLSTRPGDLDPTVASAIRVAAPTFIAITSQVDGDLERARNEFRDAEVVIFGPAFLSERVEAGAVELRRVESGEVENGTAEPSRAEPGREVRYWAPAAAPRFLAAGRAAAVKTLVRELGRFVMQVPDAAITMPPAVFIPYVAELSIRRGNWEQLKAHLERPARAAAEAVRARTGLPMPTSALAARAVSAPLARLVLDAMEALIPIDVTTYAGRHFARHMGQTEDMVTGWAAAAADPVALNEQIAALRYVVALGAEAAGN